MNSWTFIRPWWLLAFIPLITIAVYWWLRPQRQNDWLKYADKRLLEWQELRSKHAAWRWTWFILMMSLSCMVLGLAGPSWHQYPRTLSQVQKPVMVVMDLSSQMLLDDISPSRLQRAKFFLEDLLKTHRDLQWGLMVFSESSFLVSPISNDMQNMLNFLPVLQPNLLPVQGYRVDTALIKARDFLQASAASYGRILVISSQKPSPQLKPILAAIQEQSYEVFWVMDADFPVNLSRLGAMPVVNIKTGGPQVNAWLNQTNFAQMQQSNLAEKVMQRRDEGPWFLLIAMVLLLNVFRKGWFLRLWV